MVGEEILQEIDATLDQLIRNAEALQGANIQELSSNEIEAFQKTQESLIHHFIHMDQLFDAKKNNLKVPEKKSGMQKIEEKIHQFEKLESDYQKILQETARKQTTPILLKRRTKRFFYAGGCSDRPLVRR